MIRLRQIFYILPVNEQIYDLVIYLWYLLTTYILLLITWNLTESHKATRKTTVGPINPGGPFVNLEFGLQPFPALRMKIELAPTGGSQRDDLT
jgi:hypothetical protein